MIFYPGMFFSVQVQNSDFGPTSISIPVTWGEIEVIKCICRESITKMLGIDRAWGDEGMSFNAPPPLDAPEWASELPEWN